MKMIINPLNRTRTIGVKVNQDSYEALRTFAEKQGKPLGEWCREKLLEAAKPPTPSPTEHALMAEIAATQNITVRLLYEMAIGRKLSRDRVQEVLDSAHTAKYGDADERLEQALARPGGSRPAMSSPAEREEVIEP